MKVIAALQADLEETPLGTRSRLAEELDRVPILRRTVARLARSRQIDAVHVLCPSTQFDRCARLLEGTTAVVSRYEAGAAPWALLTRTARKWSLDGWRGGIGGTSSFDEYTDCRLLSGLLETGDAEAVLSVPPAAPLIDPGFADGMIEQCGKVEEDVRLIFSQAPPGLAGLLLRADLIRELAEKNAPVGWIFGYQPDSPRKDLIFQPCCYEIPAEVRYGVGRLVADTDRATEAVTALYHDLGEADPVSIGQWLQERAATFVPPVPREVEIELTTDDPCPDALLRPRGRRVENRGPIDPALIERIVREIARYDDALIVLGGFGDPLRHPQFTSILEAVAKAKTSSGGPYGLAVRTTAVDLTDEQIQAMIAYGVDVLNVTLDAWTADLYGRLHSPRDPAAVSLDNVRRRLGRVSELRQQSASVRPIVLPEFTKARENAQELDAFHDGWIRQVGAVCVRGYSHHARQSEDRRVISMTPPERVPCRRIRSRALVLADGRMTLCDQDLHGHHAVGSLTESTVPKIWRNAEFERVRAAHQAGQFAPTALCRACEEWHRP